MRDLPCLNWHKRLRQQDDKEVSGFTEVHVPIPTPEQQAQIRPAHTPQGQICNFCIIIHIDHGRSTLTDHMLQLTDVVEAHEMRDQYLDRMDVEHEHGITIRSQAVRIPWTHEGIPYTLSIIDAPSRADFAYKVSRSLTAYKGAVLLVDATQDIETQTLADLYLTLKNDLTITPILSKVDLPGAQPKKYAHEVTQLIGCDENEVPKVSNKIGEDIEDLLDRIIEVIPTPERAPDAPTRAMIFDSVYGVHHDIVAYVRAVDGVLSTRQCMRMISMGAAHGLLELGVISPEPESEEGIGAGEVGYLVTGVKDARQSRVGDTIASQVRGAAEPLKGYRDPDPMVSSSIYPVDESDFPDLRDALKRLQLDDAVLTFGLESSAALGFGFRCGFLGLLHLEIIHEYLERELSLDLIATVPNVVYRVVTEDGIEMRVDSPNGFPRRKISEAREPVVSATILTPTEFTGTIMELCQERRGSMQGTDCLNEDRVELHYQLPLAKIVFDFFDQLRSHTRGYASLDYQESGEQNTDLVKIDILFNGDRVDTFSAVVHRNGAYNYGQRMTKRLKGLIPRQQSEIPIQAAVGARVITRETIKALRKNILAKCCGGDIGRKRKLLEKQEEDKERMKSIGRVDVPQEAFIAALTSDAPTGRK